MTTNTDTAITLMRSNSLTDATLYPFAMGNYRKDIASSSALWYNVCYVVAYKHGQDIQGN